MYVFVSVCMCVFVCVCVRVCVCGVLAVVLGIPCIKTINAS